MALIQVTCADAIGTIAFDHYEKRNSLGADLIAEVLAALEAMKKDHIRVVVLRAVGNEKVWSAGHDVEELPKANRDPLPYADPLEQVLRAVRAFPAPVIAMIHGSVWGGACDLVMNCDLVIGDETCAFAITPAKLGLPYNAAGFVTFLSRLPLGIAKELFFTANLLSAERAERAGLVNQVVPAADLETHTYGLAKTIASRSAASITVAKESLNLLSHAVPLSPAQFEYLGGLRRAAYFGPDYLEGIQSFLEKRVPHFQASPSLEPR